MEYTKKIWNENQKTLKNLFSKELTFKDAIDLFMDQHARVHSSSVSGSDYSTFEDELWDNINDGAFRIGQNKKGRTVAYGMWHSTRIEDITMNLLIAGEDQIIDQNNWIKKLNTSIYDTGNALGSEEILEFSKTIDMDALKEYRKIVGIRTREIVKSLTYKSLKIKTLENGLKKAVSLGAVVNDDKAIWLIDFWKKKTVLGILLMPATRHNLVHINECIEAKKKGIKLKINI